ncbi:peptidase MA family metallohydrolase [Thermohalobacter berrensis]|uniref:Peptidase MA-like domain-containing protein n=1 Tax=Thermohalobacter berrensis TaxID=99594 RepID=A0A419T3U6_9FIRM|nr:peptidase MA family metallohydrolase [Thermohalobacter berrensis]RKD32096.1 hypothetical protein BET03_11540 [Thermohalobacter berrensis]
MIYLLNSTFSKILAFTLIVILMFLVVSDKLFGFIKISLYPILKNIEKYRILSSVKEYKKLETKHFTIRYNDGNFETAKLTGEIAEKYYDEVCSMFDYHTTEKSDIIIYNDGKKLMENTRINKDIPPLGVYYGGVINILSPEHWIKDKENFAIIYEKKGPVVHEFAHLIVDKITNGNYPMWLTEGIALYTEYKLTGFEWRRDLKNSRDITIEQLNNNFYSINQSKAYRKSFVIVNKISKNWGFDKITLLLDVLGEGNNIRHSAKAVLKVNLYDID